MKYGTKIAIFLAREGIKKKHFAVLINKNAVELSYYITDRVKILHLGAMVYLLIIRHIKTL